MGGFGSPEGVLGPGKKSPPHILGGSPEKARARAQTKTGPFRRFWGGGKKRPPVPREKAFQEHPGGALSLSESPSKNPLVPLVAEEGGRGGGTKLKIGGSGPAEEAGGRGARGRAGGRPPRGPPPRRGAAQGPPPRHGGREGAARGRFSAARCPRRAALPAPSSGLGRPRRSGAAGRRPPRRPPWRKELGGWPQLPEVGWFGRGSEPPHRASVGAPEGGGSPPASGAAPNRPLSPNRRGHCRRQCRSDCALAGRGQAPRGRERGGGGGPAGSGSLLRRAPESSPGRPGCPSVPRVVAPRRSGDGASTTVGWPEEPRRARKRRRGRIGAETSSAPPPFAERFGLETGAVRPPASRRLRVETFRREHRSGGGGCVRGPRGRTYLRTSHSASPPLRLREGFSSAARAELGYFFLFG